jgi:HK97 family phage major capsid protein
MSVTAHDLGQQIQQLTKDISKKKGEESTLRQKADELAADYASKGVNVLDDKEAFAAVDAAYKVADDIAGEISEMDVVRQKATSWLGEKSPAPSLSAERGMSVVEAFMADPVYQQYAKAGVFEGGQQRIELPGAEVLGRADLIRALRSKRGLQAATVDAEPLIPSDRQLYPPVTIPVRQPRIVDLLTVTTTESNLIEYSAMITRTDVAAPTAKGTAYSDATYEWELREAPVRDIGQGIPAHRSELADQGQLEALLGTLLSVGVELALEDEVVAGDGTGQHLTGILETDGINSVFRDVTTPERRVETLHRAITRERLTLFGEPDGMVLHPTDYEETIFEKTSSTGGYVWIGALSGLASGTPTQLWGKPVVITPAVPQNTGIVGNFKLGATVYMRAGVSVRASDSHSDFFTRRMVQLLAETRAAFAVRLPVAFCEVTLI